MYVYLITNTANGKYYVGQTIKSIEDRWKGHRKETSLGSTFRLHNAIRKYGAQHFIVEVLTTATSKEQLDQLERLWIIALRSYDRSVGYNMTMGGDGAKGTTVSEETKQRMSAAHKKRWLQVSKEERVKLFQSRKGKPCSDERRRNISLGNKGKVRSQETRKKISDTLKAGSPAKGNTHALGYKHTEETKAKLRAAHLGRKLSAETRERMKAAWVLRKAANSEVL